MRPPQHILSLRVFNESNDEITVKVTQENTITDAGNKVTTVTIAPKQQHHFEEHNVEKDECVFVCPVSVAEITAKGTAHTADLSVDQIVAEFHVTVNEKDGAIELVGKSQEQK